MEKKLISEAQAGFMKGKSPLDNLVALEHEVHETFLRKEFLLTIFFDLAKSCVLLLLIDLFYKKIKTFPI